MSYSSANSIIWDRITPTTLLTLIVYKTFMRIFQNENYAILPKCHQNVNVKGTIKQNCLGDPLLSKEFFFILFCNKPALNITSTSYRTKKIGGAFSSYRYKIAVFYQYQVMITSRCKRHNRDYCSHQAHLLG